MNLKSNSRVCVLGKTQSGKSTFISFLLSFFKNYIIYDVKRKDYNTKGAVVHSISDLEQQLKQGCKRVVYQPLNASIDEFDQVCEFIVSKTKNIVFVVDEVQLFCSKYKIGENFRSMITLCQGEPHNIGIIAISQRPQNIHNDLISQSEVFFTFRISQIHDAQAISERTGINAELIINIEQYCFYCYNENNFNNPISKHTPINSKNIHRF